MSLGTLGSKFGLFGIIHGGVRFAQGYGGFLTDNNCLALAFASTVPLCWYARELVKSFWLKLLLLVMAVCTMAGTIMTHSRGGAVALGVVLVFIVLRSKHRIVIAPLLLVAISLAVYMVRDSYIDRLATMKTPTTEASANNRLLYAQAAARMIMDYPVFGVGFGMQNEMRLLQRYADEPLGTPVLHNTYLQMATDSGLPAALLYAAWLLGTVLWLGRSAKRFQREYPESNLWSIPRALQTSLIGAMVAGLFLSRVHLDLIYFLMMCSVSWHIIQQDYRPEEPLETPENQPAAVAFSPHSARSGVPTQLL
jgi:probable O-glycosylation ligase (exosortase A-associated)